MVSAPTIKLLRLLAFRTVQIFPMLFANTEQTYQMAAADERDMFRDRERYHYPNEQKYWTPKTTAELIAIADMAYLRGNYLEVYELLNRLKYMDNTDVQWRIARSLYKLSQDTSFPNEIRKDMIAEAYELLTSVNIQESNPNVYKWLAIVLDSKNCFDGLDKQVLAYPQVKQLLLKAIQLNPDDSTCYYILGKWCFDMSRMSWVQKFFTKLFFGPVPDTSYEEAYDYLLKSYQIRQDNYYIPIMYMLGKTCYQLRQYYRADFYLKNAVILEPRTRFEQECLHKSKKLLGRLELFNLTKEAVLFEYPFKI